MAEASEEQNDDEGAAPLEGGHRAGKRKCGGGRKACKKPRSAGEGAAVAPLAGKRQRESAGERQEGGRGAKRIL